MSFSEGSLFENSFILEIFGCIPGQEVAFPPSSLPHSSGEPYSTESHIDVDTTLRETGMTSPDEPFAVRSPRNFQDQMLLQLPPRVIHSGDLKHDDVALPGTMVSTIPNSQSAASAWSDTASAVPTPELQKSARNSSIPIHSPPSHVTPNRSSLWSVHGPVHTWRIPSLADQEGLYEDHRTAMLQGARQSLALVPPGISWYPHVEAVGNSTIAAFQSPSLITAPMASNLRRGSTPGRTGLGLQAAVVSAVHDPDPPAKLPLPKRKASWSSYTDRPTKALRCNGLLFDEDDLKESRNMHGDLIDVYICRWKHDEHQCGMHIIGDRKQLARHLLRWHGSHRENGQRKVSCCWGDCGKVMKGENVSRHIIATHLKVKWRCSVCHIKLSRDDASVRHFERVKSCKNGISTVEKGPEAQEVDVHKF